MRYKQGIKDMKTRHSVLHPSANLISPVTLFDYTKVPVSITVGSPDSYRPPGYDTNESLRIEFEETVKQVEEGEGRFTLLQTHLAQGKMPLVLWIAQPVEEV
jgi:hypothetical protein